LKKYIALHLYLPLEGEESHLQLETIAAKLRRSRDTHVLVGGGWCYTGGYCRHEGPPTFSPVYLASKLREMGVGPERTHYFRQGRMPPCRWWTNVVSTWGEVKQMHMLLRVAGSFDEVFLQFVGVKSHMERAVWLWKCYNALMSLVGEGVDIAEYKIDGIENRMGEEWSRGERVRNLIAYLDPFGVGPAFVIHALRRWQARGSYQS